MKGIWILPRRGDGHEGRSVFSAGAIRRLVPLEGLGLLGLAFREELPRAGRLAAGLGAGIIFAAMAIQLAVIIF